MKTFQLTADIQFEAEDLDAAFAKLRDHFATLTEGGDSDPWFEGEMALERYQTYAGVQLTNIFGELPEGATAFHTEGKDLIFLIGSTGAFATITATDEQYAALLNAGLPGSYGTPLV